MCGWVGSVKLANSGTRRLKRNIVRASELSLRAAGGARKVISEPRLIAPLIYDRAHIRALKGVLLKIPAMRNYCRPFICLSTFNMGRGLADVV